MRCTLQQGCSHTSVVRLACVTYRLERASWEQALWGALQAWSLVVCLQLWLSLLGATAVILEVLVFASVAPHKGPHVSAEKLKITQRHQNMTTLTAS